MGLKSYIAALYKTCHETDTFVAVAKRQSPEIFTGVRWQQTESEWETEKEMR